MSYLGSIRDVILGIVPTVDSILLFALAFGLLAENRQLAARTTISSRAGLLSVGMAIVEEQLLRIGFVAAKLAQTAPNRAIMRPTRPEEQQPCQTPRE